MKQDKEKTATIQKCFTILNNDQFKKKLNNR